MKGRKESLIAEAGGAPAAGQTKAAETAEPVYPQINLALDVHAGNLVVVCMVDGAKTTATPEDDHQTVPELGDQTEGPSP